MGSIFKGFVVLIFFLALNEGNAQTQRHPFFSEKGGITGFGYGVNSFSLPQGRYTPVYFIGRLGLDLVKAKRKIMPAKFMLYFEPQINPVVIQKPGNAGHAFEFGLGIGLQHMYPVRKNLYVYSLISTGPHFITVHTDRQAHGFIFSDTMGAGTYFFLSKNTALNTGFRIRHMSNANTRMPNHGINTLNFVIGISRMLGGDR